MRLIDADAFDKCLEQVEIEATKSRKYVFSSAINTIRGNLANFPTVNQWIPVTERLPEEHVDVLCCFTSHGKTRIRVSHRMDYNYWNEVGRTGDMVAWQPLPEPYKEGE